MCCDYLMTIFYRDNVDALKPLWDGKIFAYSLAPEYLFDRKYDKFNTEYLIIFALNINKQNPPLKILDWLLELHKEKSGESSDNTLDFKFKKSSPGLFEFVNLYEFVGEDCIFFLERFLGEKNIKYNITYI